VKASPAGAGPVTAVTGAPTPENPDADADLDLRSTGLSLLRVDKSSSFSSAFYQFPDCFPLVTVTVTLEGPARRTCFLTHAGRRTARPVRALRGPERERRAARQRSDLSERAARTAGRALRGPRTGSTGRKRPLAGRPGTPARTRDDHREDRPDACGAVRGGRRRPAVLYLTFVRTTQERLTLSNSGSTAVARWSL
jgi:hypothetical protein